jgi:hypothetical protein
VRTAALTDVDGDETITADGPLETLTRIDVEAQADTDGAFDFGYTSIAPVRDAVGTHKRWLVVSNAAAAAADTGAVHVAYPDDTTDTVLLAKGAELKGAPSRVFGTTTTVAVTIYE